MAQGPVRVEVEGLRALQRALSKLGDADLKRELRTANKSAAEVVATEAKRRAPRRSGRLARSIGARGGLREGSVKAGTASRVPYAGPIHFGWPKRNIEPQPFLFDAFGAKAREVRARYEKSMEDLADKFNR